MNARRLVLVARRPALAAALVVLAVAGCGTVPPVHLHTLMPAEPPARSPATWPGAPAISLERIRLPAQVDQPQWVVRLGNGGLVALEQERWAAPLADEFGDALREQLVRRHGLTDARAAGPSPAAYVRVSVELRRFESLPGREARIEGSWALTPATGRSAPLRCEFLIGEPVAAGLAALVDGHRRAIVRLADAIAANLRRLGEGSGADCGDRPG